MAVSCTKYKTKTYPDITNPVINITTPVKNAAGPLNSNAIMKITGTVTDNDLNYIDVKVFNLTDTTLLFNNNETLVGKSFSINYNYTYKTLGVLKKCMMATYVKDGTGNSARDTTYFDVK